MVISDVFSTLVSVIVDIVEHPTNRLVPCMHHLPLPPSSPTLAIQS